VVTDISNGILVGETIVTLQEILLGFAISSVLAVLIGILVGEFDFLKNAIYPYLIAIQATPVMTIAPIIILIFGYGIMSKVVIGGLISFFPILTNVVNGLNSVDKELLELIKSFRASRFKVLTKVKLPCALPYIFTGLETSSVICVVGVIFGEFLGSSSGLGNYIVAKQFNLDSSAIFSAVVILTLIGMLMFFSIRLIHKKVTFWEGK